MVLPNSTITEFATFSGYLEPYIGFPKPNFVVYSEDAPVFHLEFVVPKLEFVAFNPDFALLKLDFEVP